MRLLSHFNIFGSLKKIKFFLFHKVFTKKIKKPPDFGDFRADGYYTFRSSITGSNLIP